MSISVYSDKKFRLFTFVWWGLVMLLQFWILFQLGNDYFHSITDAVASGMILALLCSLTSNNMQYYLPRKEKYWFILISALMICFIWLLLLVMVFHLIFPKGDLYILFLKNSAGIRFGLGFLVTSSLTMFSLQLYSQQEKRDVQEMQSESEKLTREAELFKLRQQLQPHFLFNSLNSINSLIGSQPEKARQMVQQLSDFLRGMLQKDDTKLIPLQKELEYTRLYLDIEKVRFGHRLRTEVIYHEDLLNYLLPPFLLQPIVENAIKFGLYNTTGDVLIKITAVKMDNYLKIIVQNPFDPKTASAAQGTGFGISSIQRRLYLLFSRTDLVRTHTSGNEFITEILIPQP